MPQNFRTILPKRQYPFFIGHHQSIMCIGSCFAQHLYQKLKTAKFNCLLNPMGILYNPFSIGLSIEMLLSPDFAVEKQTLFQHNGLWHSFLFHGSFSKPSAEQALEQMNQSLAAGRDLFKNAQQLIVSFGSAHVFVWKKNGQIVGNCHKLPSQEFDRKILTLSEILEQWHNILNVVHTIHPSLQVIFTVSPVRHLRDGLVENQLSKALLVVVAHELCKTYPFAHYFPAYELLLDDLRDYRFYERDLSHPNAMAVDYIWEYFQDCFFNTPTKAILEEVEKIVSAGNHRPLFMETELHQTFVKKQLQKIQQLQDLYPYMDWQRETQVFEQQIKHHNG